jgi:methylenetetrahydrofolate dehydrogenase (NADP+)/methenyltetrahydrofolate cyclohydrolase
VYVRNKTRACREAGIVSFEHRLAASTPQPDLLALLDRLNRDPAVHGILVQLPLPGQLSVQAVVRAVSPHKDVDGFHPENAGLLAGGNPRFVPCTPAGILRLLDHAGIVGKPAALLLLDRHATVTVCHSRTRDLPGILRQADVLIAAAGRPRFITADMVKPGVAIVDVGINREPDGPNAGKLCGDVDFQAMLGRASFVTPVPGGVGPMTIAMLLENTVRAAELAAGAGS